MPLSKILSKILSKYSLLTLLDKYRDCQCNEWWTTWRQKEFLGRRSKSTRVCRKETYTTTVKTFKNPEVGARGLCWKADLWYWFFENWSPYIYIDAWSSRSWSACRVVVWFFWSSDDSVVSWSPSCVLADPYTTTHGPSPLNALPNESKKGK